MRGPNLRSQFYRTLKLAPRPSQVTLFKILRPGAKCLRCTLHSGLLGVGLPILLPLQR